MHQHDLDPLLCPVNRKIGIQPQDGMIFDLVAKTFDATALTWQPPGHGGCEPRPDFFSTVLASGRGRTAMAENAQMGLVGRRLALFSW
jgi:hypothetical protein